MNMNIINHVLLNISNFCSVVTIGNSKMNVKPKFDLDFELFNCHEVQDSFTGEALKIFENLEIPEQCC